MNNFNSINNNLINTNNNIAPKKADIVQNNSNNQTNQQQNILQDNALIHQQTTNQIFAQNFQLNKMDNETILKYLQSLLNLPTSIEQFVNQQKNIKNNKQILKILTENLINTKELAELLNKNSAQAIEKILQTISTTLRSGVSDIEQLKEIMSILVSIQSSTNLSSNALKELILLYIPLNMPVFDKQAEFQDLQKANSEKIKSSALSIMLSTKNFSNILCCINLQYNDILLDIAATETFPFDRFINILQELSKKTNTNVFVEKTTIKQEFNFQEQNIKIFSQGSIPGEVLIMSHIIIKTIFKIDNDFE